MSGQKKWNDKRSETKELKWQKKWNDKRSETCDASRAPTPISLGIDCIEVTDLFNDFTDELLLPTAESRLLTDSS